MEHRAAISWDVEPPLLFEAGPVSLRAPYDARDPRYKDKLLASLREEQDQDVFDEICRMAERAVYVKTGVRVIIDRQGLVVRLSEHRLPPKVTLT